MKLLFIYCTLFHFVSYSSVSQNQIKFSPIKSSVSKKKLSNQDWSDWLHKDIEDDSIAGISLDKAYKLLTNKKVDTTIIAVLDTRLINGNKDLSGFLWINKNEVAKNNIDDDKNGYIDDIHGWNFLGNKNGNQEYVANYEFIRIIRKFDPLFKNKKRESVTDTLSFDIYEKANKALEEELSIINQNLSYLDSLSNLKLKYEKEFTKLYPETAINISQIDSILKISKDSISNVRLIFLKEYKSNEKWYENRYKRERNHLDIYFNQAYKERAIINDNPNDLNDYYGNPIVFSDTINPKHTHSIKVVGAITANRTNNYGSKGVTNTSKIMMISISPSGDEHDKDIALGIRYAVDNGAKIINITFTKYFSLKSDWVKEALKYAEKKDVIIICSAGNYNKNLDFETYYPNDVNEKSEEILNNFMLIGSSTPLANEYLVSDYSNYGKESVDIFAPGEYIYTTKNIDEFDYASGTSYSAPIVSGVAALIRSYYPNLSASEVKQIIMESGVSYDIMVNKPSLSEEKELVPFSSLSKSGKIVNAYNALLMAEKVSKKKKK
ncbi:S8 family serine peptidase [Kordia sp.]|uniref:S8 family serine peptidase n=1 Tax=Kordia sp. TaxID=1965332 RepID=UPI003D2C34EE